jgi:tetratricopeptide (TPR) repeat protein
MGLRRKTAALMIAIAFPLAFVPLVAFGEPKPEAKGEAKGSDKYDPDNVRGISQFMEIASKGISMYGAKDTTGAIDTFKKAIQLAPRNPYGHYLLAEAYAGTGNLGEGEAAIKQALELNEPRAYLVRAHVLFLAATIAERQKKTEEAKTAWQAYAEHASKFPPDSGVHPESGAERMKALQRVVELEKAYAPVRERIAAEKTDGGKPKK